MKSQLHGYVWMRGFAVISMICCTSAVAQNGVSPQGNVGARTQNVAAPSQPFPSLNPQQQAEVDFILTNWEKQSQSTRTLECNFERWHFDLLAAPAGIHAHKASGKIKYSNPDKGLFKVENIMFYKGMLDGKPQYGPNPNRQGEHWVCTGQQLVEYDDSAKKCTIYDLPPAIQGKKIFNSPLPFVFNLDANEVKSRYWVRVLKSPKPDTYLLEAWPKRREDSAQYKMVQVVLSERFDPAALIMYAPNFDQKLAPEWDHYEFSGVKRNGITAAFQKGFLGNFIPKTPPANWTIVRERYVPPTQPQIATGQNAVPNSIRKQ